jgi:hypothetical protein|tara:strand:- start:734 stop:1282 length:549 start_codon:yes stop_codon:yes gene_type:complete
MAEQDNFMGQAAELQGTQDPGVYKEPTINPFNAPIPGQSLTDEPGNYPWEHTPTHPEIEDAAEHVYKNLQKKKNTKRLVVLLKMGIPIEALTKVTTFSGFLEGKWTVDTAKLLEPIVAMMITSIAEIGKIPAKISLGDVDDQEFFDEMAMRNMDIEKDRGDPNMLPANEGPSQPQTGLMGRI